MYDLFGILISADRVQQIGIGVSAFIITIGMVVLFVGARRERAGRALFYAFVAASFWAWGAFFYGTTGNLWLAREIRTFSIIAIVPMELLIVNFGFTYLEEARPLGRFGKAVRYLMMGAGVLLALAIVPDLFGARNFIGSVTAPPQIQLDPVAGPYLWVEILYYLLMIVVTGTVIALRARLATDPKIRRQATIIFASITLALAAGFSRWTPWYGFDWMPFIGALAAPLLVVPTFYSIKTYGMFSVRIAGAEFIVFALWTFTFLRALLSTSFQAALPDIVLFPLVIIFGILLIVSVRKGEELTVELRELNKGLEREVVERTDALVREKTEFIAVAAHQLRTPVSGLRWLFDMLRQENLNLTDEQRNLIEKGDQTAKHMAQIVNDLLNFAHLSDGSLTYALVLGDVRGVTEAGIENLREAAQKKQIKLTLSNAADVPPVLFDPGKLQFAMDNLIDNAIKYTPAGGEVDVSLAPSQDGAKISVRDTGIGITPEEQKGLFVRFFRGDRAQRMATDGSGLGLAIVKKVVEGHHGGLDIASEKDKGTTVTITLPYAPARPGGK